MKQGLVFAGGGARGAYELGAWKALQEMGLYFDIVTGTSIGSVNAAMYVQGSYEKAEELWDDLIIENVMEHTFRPDTEAAIADLLDHKNMVRSFFKTYINEKGADITPFIRLLHMYISEEKIRQSPVDFSVVTARFPSLVPLEINKAEMKTGSVTEWILASSACFPIFPMHEWEDELYIDGGYLDNLPIAAAFRMGAEQVVAIDLNPQCGHPAYTRHPLVTYIHPQEELCGLMQFDRSVTDRLRLLGYNDTMKAFGKLRGKLYSFRIPSDLSAFKAKAGLFARRLTLTEISREDSMASLLLRTGVSAECTALLAESWGNEKMSAEDYYLAALELTMKMFSFPTEQIYCIADAEEKIRNEVRSFTADTSLLPHLLHDSFERKVMDIRTFLDKREEIIIKTLADILNG